MFSVNMYYNHKNDDLRFPWLLFTIFSSSVCIVMAVFIFWVAHSSFQNDTMQELWTKKIISVKDVSIISWNINIEYKTLCNSSKWAMNFSGRDFKSIDLWLCSKDEKTYKKIFLHELGHYVDVIKNGRVASVVSYEKYAETFVKMLYK